MVLRDITDSTDSRWSAPLFPDFPLVPLKRWRLWLSNGIKGKSGNALLKKWQRNFESPLVTLRNIEYTLYLYLTTRVFGETSRRDFLRPYALLGNPLVTDSSPCAD